MKSSEERQPARLPFLLQTRMQVWPPIRFRFASQVLMFVLLAVTLGQTESGSTDSSQYAISLLTPEQMKASDRAIVEQQQSAIAASAQFYGYTINTAYAYRQIDCPVAAAALVLAYESTAANGAISRFTAVIPRAVGDTHAQIIPILRFGIVPFVPAIANPHSIEVFNAAVEAGPNAVGVLSAAETGHQPLMVRSLCYLAMVGEEPAAIRSPGKNPATILAPVPTVIFLDHEKVRQQISIRSTAETYQVWGLTFDSAGKLLTTTRVAHPVDRTPVTETANAGHVPAPAQAITSQQAIDSSVSPPAAAVNRATPSVSGSEPSSVDVAPADHAAVAVPAPAANQPAKTSQASSEPVTLPVTSSEATVPVQPSGVVTASGATNAPAVSSTPIKTSPNVPSTPVAVSAPVVEPYTAQTSPSTPPAKPPLPMPPEQFITNLPKPPGRFIPDSALKTPPHLPAAQPQ
jgi:hypothetical protein